MAERRVLEGFRVIEEFGVALAIDNLRADILPYTVDPPAPNLFLWILLLLE